MANYIVLRRLKVSYLSYINAESLMCCLFPSSHLVSCPMNDKRGRRRFKPLMIPVNLDFNRAPVLMTVFTAMLGEMAERFALLSSHLLSFYKHLSFNSLEMLTKEFWILRQFLFWYCKKSTQKCVSVCVDYLMSVWHSVMNEVIHLNH